jgi:hypothetical protein
VIPPCCGNPRIEYFTFSQHSLLKCEQNKSKFHILKTHFMEKAKKSERMSVVNPHAAGVDIGSKSHWVAIGQKKEDVKEFGSYTVNLDEICIWLKENKITTVAMESTGNYWKALYVLL